MKTIIMIMVVACYTGCYSEQSIAPAPQEAIKCVTDDDCAGCTGPVGGCAIDSITDLCGECGLQWEYCCAQIEGCSFTVCINGTCKTAEETLCQDNAACNEWCRGRDYHGGSISSEHHGFCSDCSCYYAL